MKLKLDENLSRSAAEIFREAGHDVHTVGDEGLLGSTDDDVITVCQREERGLVTLDLDFSNPLIFTPSEYHGIMVLRLSAHPSHDELLLVCRTLLQALEKEAVLGKLWSIERGRVREYRPESSGEN
ncbi:DUF5615 family PIN-like protein [Anatilimnocola floriformis]|uniref:DUF5615 family PIN-like protein n=1 Tax=Anatilimnocola floriformis TaxID=2948575 RepID=UPI0020C2D5FA|nr:DUF5615 family PIN-like protein [Anatilimnocola floriformis]